MPDLIDTELATLQDVLDRADLVCEVVDARDVLGGRSAFLEGLVNDAGGKVVLVVNKIGQFYNLGSSDFLRAHLIPIIRQTLRFDADLVPRETLEAWVAQIPIPTYLFCSPHSSASSSSSITPPVLGRHELLDFFRHSAGEKGNDDFVIAMMGLPSVGKTSIMNSLLAPSQKRQPVAPSVPSVNSAKHPAPTTCAPLEMVADIGEGVKIRIIDTPGWEYVEEEIAQYGDEERFDQLEERLAADVLRRNLGRVDRVKDVLPIGGIPIESYNMSDGFDNS